MQRLNIGRRAEARIELSVNRFGANLVKPSRLKTSTTVHRSRMYVPSTWYRVDSEESILSARGSYIGKPTTTEEPTSRGTLHHEEHVVGYVIN